MYANFCVLSAIKAGDGANATLPETIPGNIEPASTLEVPATQPDEMQPEEQFQDAQSNHEMDLASSPKGGDVDVSMEPPKVPQEADVPKTNVQEPVDVENVDKTALDRKDSVASTVSLGDFWEKEYYEYKEENGKWVKYVKDKYLPLAKARNWNLGPIPVGEEVVVPVCKGLGTVTVPQPVQPSEQPLQPQTSAPMATPQSETSVRATPQPETSAPASMATPAPPLQETAAEMDVETPTVATPMQPGQGSMDPESLPKTSGPPDRTLELAGLQALMDAQISREQAAAMQEINKFEAQRLLDAQDQKVSVAALEKIDWTTHKKEGMRLKRLIEESCDGAQNFPYMAKMWAGSKEDYGGLAAQIKLLFKVSVLFLLHVSFFACPRCSP